MTHRRIDFSAIVTSRLAELEQNAYAIENKYGLPADAIRNVSRGDKNAGPRLKRVEEICDALGLEIYIGPPRPDLAEAQKVGADFARIPRYDARLAAGPGALNSEELPSSSLAFRTDWLARIGVNPRHCCIVGVTGDSMEPTLYDGDLVMIDRKVQSWRTNRLFAFVNADGDAQVKRVRVLDTAIVLQSDNRDVDPVVVSGRDADQLTIIGQVVWAGHDFER
ncbi:S24 family peptidase [Sulfitobacter alexandrii]|nr:S24 family peptidase [Sulfitobacter alexandrii]